MGRRIYKFHNRHRRGSRKAGRIMPYRPILDSTLATALHFNRNDLTTNRGGYLSRRQRRRLWLRRFNRESRTQLLLVFICLLLTTFTARQNPKNAPPILLLPLVLMALFTVRISWWWHRVGVDLRQNLVRSAAGLVILDRERPIITVSGSNGPTHLNLPADIGAVWQEDQRYRLYYTPVTRIVVAAAPLNSSGTD